jgi:hypothetical protein
METAWRPRGDHVEMHFLAFPSRELPDQARTSQLSFIGQLPHDNPTGSGGTHLPPTRRTVKMPWLLAFPRKRLVKFFTKRFRGNDHYLPDTDLVVAG